MVLLYCVYVLEHRYHIIVVFKFSLANFLSIVFYSCRNTSQCFRGRSHCIGTLVFEIAQDVLNKLCFIHTHYINVHFVSIKCLLE